MLKTDVVGVLLFFFVCLKTFGIQNVVVVVDDIHLEIKNNCSQQILIAGEQQHCEIFSSAHVQVWSLVTENFSVEIRL